MQGERKVRSLLPRQLPKRLAITLRDGASQMQLALDPRNPRCRDRFLQAASRTHGLTEPVKTEGTLATGLQIRRSAGEGKNVVDSRRRHSILRGIGVGDGPA